MSTATRKPGIVDPWRQAPPKPPATKAGGGQADEEAPERCVSWDGHGTGFHVWMPADTENRAEVAVARVYALMRELWALNDKDVRQAFKHYGVDFGAAAGEKFPVTSMANVVRRAILSSRAAAVTLAKNKITAFIK